MSNKVNAIEAIANRANQINIPKKLFFPLLHEFSRVVLKDREFEGALEIIFERGKRAISPVQVLEKEGIHELKTNEEKIRGYAINSGIIQLLNEFRDRFKKLNRLDRMLLTPLEQALYILANDEHIDHSCFVKTFGNINQINNDRYIETATAFPKFHAWETESLYLAQMRETADWYSLNQIIVFYERYDFRHYDNLIKAMTDPIKLQEEHNTLLMYTHFDNYEMYNSFPSMQEYQHHMIRLVESIKEIITPINLSTIKTYLYDYDSFTGELKIDNNEPIKYKTNKNPAKSLHEVMKRKGKPLSFTALFNALGLSNHGRVKDLSRKEVRQVEAIIRQINDQSIRAGYPKFLIIQESKNYLGEKEILVSSSYKLV